MITVAEGQVHDYYSYLNDLPQLQAWHQGGYVLANPTSEGGEPADDEFTQEELAAMEKEIAEGGDEDVDFDAEGDEETPAPAKKEL